MSDQQQFDSSEKLIQHIKDRVDDIDCVCINLAGSATITKKNGSIETLDHAGAVIVFCTNDKSVIHLHDAELLINDGVLQRLRIPVRLISEGQPLPRK